MKAVAFGCLAAALALGLSSPASAQDSKSGPLAKELVAALDSAKLDSVAAKDPSAPDVFIGALYIPGLQLLVVSGQYAVPQLLDDRLLKKEYRDVYLDLQGSSAPGSKVFIEDLGADGLRARRASNQPFDSWEAGGKRTMFDSEWKAQKISEEEYMKTYSAADERYAKILAALLAQVKKT